MADRTWLDDMQAVVRNLRGHASTFRDLAARCHAAEMDRAAAIALNSAQEADEDAEALSVAIGAKLTSDLRDSQEMTSAVFRAAVAGITLGERGDPLSPSGGAR